MPTLVNVHGATSFEVVAGLHRRTPCATLPEAREVAARHPFASIHGVHGRALRSGGELRAALGAEITFDHRWTPAKAEAESLAAAAL